MNASKSVVSVVLTAVVALMSACGSEPLPADTRFHASEITVGSKTERLASPDGLVLTFSPDASAASWRLCNRRSARITGSDSTLQMQERGAVTTLIKCMGVSSADERAVDDFLLSDPEWSYDGEKLILEQDEVTIEMSRRNEG
ncbi:META domain-containing protein [Thermoleophilia bacterium SCSIO 60948]|nr:META domain-containing protein [Thermoleophilia bacterium SCSIO 60948]